MTPELAYTIIPIFTIFFLGILVFLHDRKSVINIFFTLICISTVFWTISNYFSLTVSPDQVLFWIRFVLFFATSHAIFFLLLILNFPQRNLVIKKVWLYILAFVMGVTMILTISPFVFSRIEIKNGSVVPIPGTLMPLFSLVILGSLISALCILIAKYLRALNIEKRQWSFMLLGTSLSYILIIITNFLFVILFQNTNFNIFGPMFMLPTFIGMSYAILRYHLFNFKAISVEIFTFIILSISLFEILVSRSILELGLRIVLFIFFFIFSTLLIRGVLREIERRAEVQKLYEEVDRLSKAKSEFISIVSHQLRTPLTAIKGYVSMMLDGDYGKVVDGQRAKLEGVYQSNEKLISFINDLLNVSRIEKGKIELELGKGRIEDIITGEVEELKIKAREKNLYLNWERPKEPFPELSIDVGKVKQVVANLIDNAIKYTEKGGATINVKFFKTPDTGTVSGVFVGPKIQVAVADTGTGMTQEEIGKLFGSFARGEAGKKMAHDGLGIGLYIARKFVELHGGKMWAGSPGKGKGSTFCFDLPVKQMMQDSQKG